MTVKESKDLEKFDKITRIERKLFSNGYSHIAGVDEAGRGPLAGPLVAAAVIFQDIPTLCRIRDSKLVPEKEREDLFDTIIESALDYGIGVMEVEDLNRIANIHRASLLAMKIALDTLSIRPSYILVDGKFIIPGIEQKQEAVIDGDALSYSIAAASILAKVTRDRLMRKFDLEYPGYGFMHNKGYGTPDHLDALDRLGPCRIHRSCFAPVREALQGRLL